jgi:hypothetical protein
LDRPVRLSSPGFSEIQGQIGYFNAANAAVTTAKSI